MIKEMSNLSKCSIFVLYNRKKNKALMCLAKDQLKRLSQIISELKNRNFRIKEMYSDIEDLEIITLEDCQTDLVYEDFKLHMSYWYDYLERIGIDLYSNRHTYIEYKARCSEGINELGESVIQVELVTKRNKTTLVGVFRNTIEAEDFISQYYNNRVNPYNYPVYSCNEMTTRYFRYLERDILNMFKLRF